MLFRSNKPTHIRKCLTWELKGNWTWEVFVFSDGVFADYSIHSTQHMLTKEVAEKDMNKIFYTIIKKFGDLTGTYVLLNTSLNLHGNPIVNDSNDLINLLKNSKIDGCIMKNFMILRV